MGWVSGHRYPDPAELASPVDLKGSYILDAWGGVHQMAELQAPTMDVFSVDRLTAVQDQLVALLSRLPESIGEVEFMFTATGDYGPMLGEYTGFEHDREVLQKMRQLKGELASQEIREGILIPAATHITLGSVPVLRKNEKFLRQPVTDMEFCKMEPVLQNAVEVAQDWAHRVGAKITILGGDRVADYFYRVLNHWAAVELGIPVRYREEETQFLDSWLLGDVDTVPWKTDGRIAPGSGLIRWDETYHTVVSLMGKPLETWPRISDTVSAGIPFRQFRTLLRIRRLDQIEERARLRAKRVEAEAAKDVSSNWLELVQDPLKTTGRTQDGQSSNEEANEMVREANALIADLRGGRESLMLAQQTWHLWHRDPVELIRRRDILLTRLGDMGSARGYAERHAVLPILLQSMPAAGGPMLEPKKYRSRMIADMCLLNRGFETSDKPVALFRNATNGLVPIDLFDSTTATAPMAFISGATGSGKSVLALALLCSHALRGVRILILDVGGSYNQLADLLGIRVFTFNPKKPVCFNLFQVLSLGDGLHEPGEAEIARYAKALEAFLASPKEEAGLSAEMKNIVVVSITHAFAKAINRKKTMVTLSDFSDALKTNGAQELVERLRPYVRGGTWGEWFDGATEWRPDGEALVMDLQGFKDYPDLARPLIPLCVDLIQDLILNSRDVRKIFVCDEIFEYIRHPLLADRIIGAFKRYRKENTAVIGSSQSIADLNFNSRIAEAIEQCVQTWFLFTQGDDSHVESVQKLLGLTSGQVNILNDLRSSKRVNESGHPELFRECLMVRGKGTQRESGRLRINLMPEEYWLFSTKPNESVLRSQGVEAANGDLWLALRTLAREYPVGIPEKR